MPHSASPALDADHRIADVENTQLDRVHDAPAQAAVDVLLPWRLVEVGLRLVEEEGVDTAVQVRVLRMWSVASFNTCVGKRSFGSPEMHARYE